MLDFIVMVLVSDVSSDNVLINTHGGDKVATGPEGMCFIEAVLAFDLLLEPRRAFALENLHGIGDRVSRSEYDAQVNVVFLNGKLKYFPVLPFHNGLKDASQFILYFLCAEHLAAILGRKDDVVFQIIEAV